MARTRHHDTTALREARSVQKAEKNEERHVELVGDISDVLDAILDKCFPLDKDGDPDYDNYQWDRAERLLETLLQFLTGRRQTGDDQTRDDTRKGRRAERTTDEKPADNGSKDDSKEEKNEPTTGRKGWLKDTFGKK